MATAILQIPAFCLSCSTHVTSDHDSSEMDASDNVEYIRDQRNDKHQINTVLVEEVENMLTLA